MAERRPWSRQRGPRPERAPVVPDLAERLLTLARPLVPMGGDAQPDDWRRALIMAITGWNASIIPRMLTELIEQSSDEPEVRSALRAAADAVRERKELLFPEDRRVIVDWRFQVGEDGEATLHVASSDPVAEPPTEP